MCRLVLLLAITLAAQVARAEEEAAPEKGRPEEKGTIGVGIILGEPTGICGKIYLKDDQAIQVAVGAAFATGGLQVHGDYVFHPWVLQDRDSFVLPFYLGPGVRFIQYNPGRGAMTHYAAGLRAVVGFLFDFKSVPLDVFVEVAGVLEWDFTNGIGGAINGGAGIRYYF